MFSLINNKNYLRIIPKYSMIYLDLAQFLDKRSFSIFLYKNICCGSIMVELVLMSGHNICKFYEVVRGATFSLA